MFKYANNGRHENCTKLRKVPNIKSNSKMLNLDEYPALKKAVERVKENVKNGK